MRHLFGDAVQSLRRTPLITAAIVLTLAIAIGANTAIYSAIHAVLVRDLPYPGPDRIVRVAATFHPSVRLPGFSGAGGQDGEAHFSDAGYWHFVRTNRSFAEMGAYRPGHQSTPLAGNGIPNPLQVSMAQLSASAFRVLGVHPVVGRLPTAEEDLPTGPRVALLSHRLWASQFGSDPAILGRTIQLWGTATEVIGVMPASYTFPFPETDVWIPLRLNPASQLLGHNIAAIARLLPNATTTSATADAKQLIAQFDRIGYPARWLTTVFDGNARVWTLKEDIVGNVRRPMLLVFGTVDFVLLIACGNVANLMLVRAEQRHREYAVRQALGAGRGCSFRSAGFGV